MSSTSFLDFQYSLSKRKLSPKPSRQFSGLNSDPFPTYTPNLDEMRKVFEKFDSNKDGKISQQEYKSILKALGTENMIDEEVVKIFDVADLNRDGFIDFEEFFEVQKREGGIKKMDIRNAFRTFDLNGDGKISAEEILMVLRKLGERFQIEDCRKMVNGVDVDGDGMVDIDEFMSMMTRSMKLC